MRSPPHDGQVSPKAMGESAHEQAKGHRRSRSEPTTLHQLSPRGHAHGKERARKKLPHRRYHSCSSPLRRPSELRERGTNLLSHLDPPKLKEIALLALSTSSAYGGGGGSGTDSRDRARLDISAPTVVSSQQPCAVDDETKTISGDGGAAKVEKGESHTASGRKIIDTGSTASWQDDSSTHVGSFHFPKPMNPSVRQRREECLDDNERSRFLRKDSDVSLDEKLSRYRDDEEDPTSEAADLMRTFGSDLHCLTSVRSSGSLYGGGQQRQRQWLLRTRNSFSGYPSQSQGAPILLSLADITESGLAHMMETSNVRMYFDAELQRWMGEAADEVDMSGFEGKSYCGKDDDPELIGGSADSCAAGGIHAVSITSDMDVGLGLDLHGGGQHLESSASAASEPAISSPISTLESNLIPNIPPCPAHAAPSAPTPPPALTPGTECTGISSQGDEEKNSAISGSGDFGSLSLTDGRSSGRHSQRSLSYGGTSTNGQSLELEPDCWNYDCDNTFEGELNLNALAQGRRGSRSVASTPVKSLIASRNSALNQSRDRWDFLPALQTQSNTSPLISTPSHGRSKSLHIQGNAGASTLAQKTSHSADSKNGSNRDPFKTNMGFIHISLCDLEARGSELLSSRVASDMSFSPSGTLKDYLEADLRNSTLENIDQAGASTDGLTPGQVWFNPATMSWEGFDEPDMAGFSSSSEDEKDKEKTMGRNSRAVPLTDDKEDSDGGIEEWNQDFEGTWEGYMQGFVCSKQLPQPSLEPECQYSWSTRSAMGRISLDDYLEHIVMTDCSNTGNTRAQSAEYSPNRGWEAVDGFKVDLRAFGEVEEDEREKESSYATDTSAFAAAEAFPSQRSLQSRRCSSEPATGHQRRRLCGRNSLMESEAAAAAAESSALSPFELGPSLIRFFMACERRHNESIIAFMGPHAFERTKREEAASLCLHSRLANQSDDTSWKKKLRTRGYLSSSGVARGAIRVSPKARLSAQGRSNVLVRTRSNETGVWSEKTASSRHSVRRQCKSPSPGGRRQGSSRSPEIPGRGGTENDGNGERDPRDPHLRRINSPTGKLRPNATLLKKSSEVMTHRASFRTYQTRGPVRATHSAVDPEKIGGPPAADKMKDATNGGTPSLKLPKSSGGPRQMLHGVELAGLSNQRLQHQLKTISSNQVFLGALKMSQVQNIINMYS